jgi:hypothetical protein
MPNPLLHTRITNPKTLERRAAELQAAALRPPIPSIEEQIRALIPKATNNNNNRKKKTPAPKSEIKNLGPGTVFFT